MSDRMPFTESTGTVKPSVIGLEGLPSTLASLGFDLNRRPAPTNHISQISQSWDNNQLKFSNLKIVFVRANQNPATISFAGSNWTLLNCFSWWCACNFTEPVTNLVSVGSLVLWSSKRQSCDGAAALFWRCILLSAWSPRVPGADRLDTTEISASERGGKSYRHWKRRAFFYRCWRWLRSRPLCLNDFTCSENITALFSSHFILFGLQRKVDCTNGALTTKLSFGDRLWFGIFPARRLYICRVDGNTLLFSQVSEKMLRWIWQ